MTDKKPQKELIANANSEGLILDYYNTAGNATGFSRPVENYRKYFKYVQEDPVVRASLITLVDRTLETPWQIVGRDKKSKKQELELNLRDLRFNKVLRKIVYNLVLFGNAYVEIVKRGGKVSDLNVLETIHMKIRSKDNGDIVKYVQDIPNSGDDFDSPEWTPERVVHITLTDITTNVYGEVDLKAITDTVMIKDHIRQYINWFFKTNQSRGMYNIKGASDTKVKEFLSHLRAMQKDLGKPVISQGEVTYQVLRTFEEEGKSLQDILMWCDNQIIALMQVPPIALGFPDMSGRSNSTEQFRALNTRVHNIHQVIEDAITYDLFPKIGYGKNMLEFGALDDQTMKRKMETVLMMRQAGFKNEKISEWLREQDIFFTDNDLFNENTEIEPEDKPAPLRNENAPSRKRKSEGEINQVKDDVTTRDNQVVVANSEHAKKYEFYNITNQYEDFSK